jgi:MFS transporter, DHA1 family, inner membrane transport protein
LQPASSIERGMVIFGNRQFNFIYLHAALQAFAMHGGEAFAFVYLLKAGIPVHIVLLSIGALFASRLVFRKLVLPAAKRFGLRNALIFGILLEALTYPVLAQVSEVGPLLVAYLAMWAISSSFYWTTYHAFVVMIGDDESRGSQVSMMEFIGMFIGIIAPITTGLLLTYFSPLVAFGVVGICMACSAIPLMFTPNVKVAQDMPMPDAVLKQARLMLFTDGLRSGTFHFTWLIALFITLGSSFAALGGAMALAGIVGAVAGLFLGKSIDLGKGKRAAQIGFSVLAVAAMARAVGYAEPWSALLANAMAAIAWPIYSTAYNSRVYILAQQSPCPLRFHVVAEGGWDFGTATGCFAAALLTYLGFSFFWPLALALVGCGVGYWVLVGTFEKEAVA